MTYVWRKVEEVWAGLRPQPESEDARTALRRLACVRRLQMAVLYADPDGDFWTWMAENYVSGQRPGAKVGLDVVNEFLDALNRAQGDCLSLLEDCL